MPSRETTGQRFNPITALTPPPVDGLALAPNPMVIAAAAPCACGPVKKPLKLPSAVPTPLLHGPVQVVVLKPAEKRLLIGEIPELPVDWKVFLRAGFVLPLELFTLTDSVIDRFTKSAASDALLMLCVVPLKAAASPAVVEIKV